MILVEMLWMLPQAAAHEPPQPLLEALPDVHPPAVEAMISALSKSAQLQGSSAYCSIELHQRKAALPQGVHTGHTGPGIDFILIVWLRRPAICALISDIQRER